MEKRLLGASGLEVSRIGLGCVTFGREIDEKASFQIMDYAVTHGINLFDTAAAYGDGESERIVGRWLRDRRCREQIIIQSKVKPSFTPNHIQAALKSSLGRWGVDHLDIYLLHQFDHAAQLEKTIPIANQEAHVTLRVSRKHRIGVALIRMDETQTAKGCRAARP